MTRNVRVLLLGISFIVGLVACFSVVYLVMEQLGGSSAPLASAIGGPFELTDAEGKTVTDKALQGRPTLVFFGYTHCPDVCPTTLFELSQVFQALGKDADRAQAFFVSVDPERDTPPVIKDYLSSFDPHLRGLTGNLPSVETMTRAYRVYFKKIPTEGGDYTMDHTALVYLMDKEGRFVAPFNLKRTPEASAADLRRYM